VLICDSFGTHETLEILEFCLENNIILCRLPSHTSHKLQPCDVGPFAPLKAAYRDLVERLFQGGTNTVGKEHFTSLYSPAREKAFTKRNITSAWAATGLFPFNPDRVLRNTPKPPTQPTGPEIEAMKAAAYLQHEAIQTPVTPVSAEGLMSLYDQIKQDTQKLDATSTQRLQKPVQKLANAAQVSFAECALLNDRNQFLTEANNEAKVRRSTRSVVLGKAKVMSFEDIKEARAKRAAKDAVKSKGKRGRKRKNTEPKASEAELEPEVELEVVRGTKEVENGQRSCVRRRRSAAPVAEEAEAEPEPQLEPVPWRAPVARMY